MPSVRKAASSQLASMPSPVVSGSGLLQAETSLRGIKKCVKMNGGVTLGTQAMQ